MRPHAGVKFSAPRANMGIKTTSTPSSSYQDSGAEESGQSDAEMGGTVVNTPKRPMTGGKFVPGYTPSKGFSTMRLDDEADESDEERSQTAGRGGNDDEWAEEPAIKDYDDDDDDFKPDFDDDDEEADGTYGAKVNTPRTPIAVGNAAPKSGGKGRAVNNVTKGKMVEKTTYKKKPRKDACRFTTTQAMIDAEEEMHPKVAALVGKKIIGEGNGRKGGRKLIRWNSKSPPHSNSRKVVY